MLEWGQPLNVARREFSCAGGEVCSAGRMRARWKGEAGKVSAYVLKSSQRDDCWFNRLGRGDGAASGSRRRRFRGGFRVFFERGFSGRGLFLDSRQLGWLNCNNDVPCCSFLARFERSWYFGRSRYFGRFRYFGRSRYCRGGRVCSSEGFYLHQNFSRHRVQHLSASPQIWFRAAFAILFFNAMNTNWIGSEIQPMA